MGCSCCRPLPHRLTAERRGEGPGGSGVMIRSLARHSHVTPADEQVAAVERVPVAVTAAVTVTGPSRLRQDGEGDGRRTVLPPAATAS